MSNTTAQPEAADLSRFCGYTSIKLLTDFPWVFDGWRYATNGRILVRVPAPGEPDSEPPPPSSDPKYTLTYPKAAELFAPVSGPLLPWPTDGIEPGTTPCTECNETGSADRQTCPRCSGEGAFDCPECGQETECPNCDGTGFLGVADNCPVCNGRGSLDGKGRRVGVHLIGIPLDRLIQTLPRVRYETGVDRMKPLPFVFEGGEGLLMGMKE